MLTPLALALAAAEGGGGLLSIDTTLLSAIFIGMYAHPAH